MSTSTKVLLGAISVLMLISVLFVTVLNPHRERWDAMMRLIDTQKHQAETTKVARTVFDGPAEPGNAWDEYNIALGDSRPWGEESGNGPIFFQFALGTLEGRAQEATARKLTADNAWRLDHLRKGARRSDGQYPYIWRAGMMDTPSIVRTRMLSNLATAQARVLTENGKPQEAADLLLDTTLFAMDLSTNAPMLMVMTGDAVNQTVLWELHNLMQAGKFNQAQLKDISGKLETLDREFPKLATLASNTAMTSGLSLINLSNVQIGGNEWWARSKEAGWRFAASPQNYALDAIEQHQKFLDRFAKLEDLPYDKARPAVDAINAEMTASSNYFVQDAGDLNLTQILSYQRASLASIRLLRAEAAFLTTGRIPELADPFGKNIQLKREGTHITIWSLGNDGTDQNGKADSPFAAPDMMIDFTVN